MSEMERRLVKDRDVLRQFLREIRAIAGDKKFRGTTVGGRVALDQIRSLADAALCNSEPLEQMKASDGHQFFHMLKTRCMHCGRSPKQKGRCPAWVNTFVDCLWHEIAPAPRAPETERAAHPHPNE